MTRKETATKYLWSTIALCFLAALIFSVNPGIDLFVSGLFVESSGFPANDNGSLQIFRDVIWTLAIVIFLFSVIMTILMLLRGSQSQRIATRVWSFIALSYLLAPGIMANAILKENWGRARPRNISEFGGTLEFTPALQIADQCSRNCSFVSGEASSAIATALVFTLVFSGDRFWRTLIWIVAVAAAFLRIAMGGHFLSDVVFGGLFTAVIVLVLFLALRIHDADGVPRPADIFADIRSAVRPRYRT